MEIQTKIFLINWVAILSIMQFDKSILNDGIEKTKILGTLVGIWALLSICSIPAWMIWFILNQ